MHGRVPMRIGARVKVRTLAACVAGECFIHWAMPLRPTFQRMFVHVEVRGHDGLGLESPEVGGRRRGHVGIRRRLVEKKLPKPLQLSLELPVVILDDTETSN